MNGEDVRDAILTRKASSRLYGYPSKGKRGLMVGRLGDLLGRGDSGDVARHQFLEYVFDKKSSKELYSSECDAVLWWISNSGNPFAEAQMVLTAWGEKHGQLELL